MEPSSIAALISNVGFPVAMVIVLLYWIRQIQREAVEREIRLGKRIDELEKRDLDVIIKLATESKDAIKESYRAGRRLVKSTEDLVVALKARPCLTDDSFFPHQTVHAEHNLPRTQCPTGDTTKEETRTDIHKKN